jgi:hypothetical protein
LNDVLSGNSVGSDSANGSGNGNTAGSITGNNGNSATGASGNGNGNAASASMPWFSHCTRWTLLLPLDGNVVTNLISKLSKGGKRDFNLGSDNDGNDILSGCVLFLASSSCTLLTHRLSLVDSLLSPSVLNGVLSGNSVGSGSANNAGNGNTAGSIVGNDGNSAAGAVDNGNGNAASAQSDSTSPSLPSLSLPPLLTLSSAPVDGNVLTTLISKLSKGGKRDLNVGSGNDDNAILSKYVSSSVRQRPSLLTRSSLLIRRLLSPDVLNGVLSGNSVGSGSANGSGNGSASSSSSFRFMSWSGLPPLQTLLVSSLATTGTRLPVPSRTETATLLPPKATVRSLLPLASCVSAYWPSSALADGNVVESVLKKLTASH